MLLDRNVNPDGLGKYALINLRVLAPVANNKEAIIAELAKKPEALQLGAIGEEDEFFPIKLKDKYAAQALQAYADACRADDPEFAAQVDELVKRSGPYNRLCKIPD